MLRFFGKPQHFAWQKISVQPLFYLLLLTTFVLGAAYPTSSSREEELSGGEVKLQNAEVGKI